MYTKHVHSRLKHVQDYLSNMYDKHVQEYQKDSIFLKIYANLFGNMYNSDQTCTPNMYSKHVHQTCTPNLKTCTANMYIIYTKHVPQTCTYLFKHVHAFCWKFTFFRFIEPFAIFQRDP